MTSTETLWKNDSLKRKEEGEYLSNYLIKYFEKNKDSSFVLNINAEWGFGKTYFLTNLAKELENKKYPTVYFDAWKNDYSNNPLLAFISELNSSLEPYLSRSTKAKGFLKSAYDTSKIILLPALAKKATGMGIEELSDLADETDVQTETQDVAESDESATSEVSTLISKIAEKALSDHKNIQNSIELFKESMKKLLNHIDKKMTSQNLPMFIFIDELDRCRPNYAIELLENIKHIFDIPGIIFVVATDSKQLAHSINAVYGENFASEKYLKRFFHQEYTLVNPTSYDYSYYLFSNNEILEETKLFSPLNAERYDESINLNVQLFAYYADYFKLSLRDQEQVMLILISTLITWESGNKIHLGYLLFLIMLKQQDNTLFDKFIDSDIQGKSNFVSQLQPYVDSEIRFESYRHNIENLSASPSNASVEIIIDQYLNVLGQNRTTLDSPEYKTDNAARQIIIEVGRQMPGHWSGPIPPTHELNKYPNLVLRAGQFS